MEERENMVYIPLLDTLEAVLQNRNVIAEVHVHVIYFMYLERHTYMFCFVGISVCPTHT